MAGRVMLYGTPMQRVCLPDAARVEVDDGGGIAIYSAEAERGMIPGRDVSYPPGSWRDARIEGQERVFSEEAWETPQL